jgi:hypothetical protein
MVRGPDDAREACSPHEDEDRVWGLAERLLGLLRSVVRGWRGAAIRRQRRLARRGKHAAKILNGSMYLQPARRR